MSDTVNHKDKSKQDTLTDRKSIYKEITTEKAEELYQLLRLKAVTEVKKEITDWARNWGSIIVLILTILGGIGLGVIIPKYIEYSINEMTIELIQPTLNKAILAAVKADTQVAVVDRMGQKAQDEADKALKQVKFALTNTSELTDDVANTKKELDNAEEDLLGLKGDLDTIRLNTQKTTEQAITNLQSQIDALKMAVSSISKSATVSNEAKGEIDKSLSAQEESKKKFSNSIQQYSQESNYSVLIFYRDNQNMKANKIGDDLSNSGYRLSKTRTDLSEVKQHSPGTIYVSYSKYGEIILDEISTKLNDLIEQNEIAGEVVLSEKERQLKRGDIQILLF